MSVINLLREHNVVFIHIPKTGGSSIRRGYFKNDYQKFVGPEFPKEWNALFKFAFVRNPFDRFISSYKMFTEGFIENSINIDSPKIGQMSPKDFFERAKKDTNYFNTSGVGFHVFPQTHRHNHLSNVDFIGRFENLEEDFKKICDIINIPYTNLPHWNKTSSKNYKDYYDEELYELVSDYYSDDIKILNYQF